MLSPNDKILDQWLTSLGREASQVAEKVRPEKYTPSGRNRLGKEVSKRYIKIAIFGNVLQVALCTFLSIFMFPHRALPIMAFSFYLGWTYAWYVLAKLRFEKKWGLIERLEREAKEWEKDLGKNEEYLELIKPVVDKHRKLVTINNYHGLKDLLVDGNTSTEDGKHFFLTRNALDNVVFDPKNGINHLNLVMAINDTARKRILESSKESWTATSAGSVNLVTNSVSNPFMESLDSVLSRLIESISWITDTAPEIKSNQKESESDFTQNVVSLFAHKKTVDPTKTLSPHQTSFVELTRLTGNLVDIIDPVIERSRFQTVDLASEEAYLNQVKITLDEFNKEVEEASVRALSISGALNK